MSLYLYLPILLWHDLRVVYIQWHAWMAYLSYRVPHFPWQASIAKLGVAASLQLCNSVSDSEPEPRLSLTELRTRRSQIIYILQSCITQRVSLNWVKPGRTRSNQGGPIATGLRTRIRVRSINRQIYSHMAGAECPLCVMYKLWERYVHSKYE